MSVRDPAAREAIADVLADGHHREQRQMLNTMLTGRRLGASPRIDWP
jgi:hypothetical protein